MPSKLKLFLLRWVNCTVAVMVAASIVPGIHYGSLPGLLMAAFLLGILNTFLRRILIFFSLPLVVVTLGLFILVINAFLLYAVGYLMTALHAPFSVDSFMAAFWGGLVISVVSGVLNFLTGTGKVLLQIHRATTPPGDRDDGDGPVIDV